MIRVPLEIEISFSPFEARSSSTAQPPPPAMFGVENGHPSPGHLGRGYPIHGASPILRRRAGHYDYGDSSSSGELTKLITEESRQAGIDPRLMEGIRAGESGHGKNYDVNLSGGDESYGPFQLNRKHPGDLGSVFERETGLDLADPKTIPAQARWVANYLKRTGGNTSPWMGFHGPREADPGWGDAGYNPEKAPHHPWAGSYHGSPGWNAPVGDIDPALLAKVQAANPNLTPRQCVELVQSTMGVGNVHDWRRGPSAKDSPENAALATFGQHGDSATYAYGGSGTPGIGRDHALKMVKKYPDGSFDAISQDINHPPHLVHIPWTGAGGEGDASSYFAIFNKAGQPAGANSEIFRQQYLNAAAKAGSQSPQPTENQKQNGI